MGKFWDALFGLPKSIYFCFKYLPLRQAVRIPILLSRHVYLMDIKGNVEIKSRDIRFGLIKIGFGKVGIFDSKYSRTIWQNGGGKVTFKGKAAIGHGSRISINENGEIIFGINFNITAESAIISSKRIIFGDNVLISWNCLFMDTDFHHIYVNDEVVNLNRDICIGNHVWIGCRSTVLKGVKIPDNCIIAANSNVTRSITCENVIAAGNPAVIKKEFTYWEG